MIVGHWLKVNLEAVLVDAVLAYVGFAHLSETAADSLLNFDWFEELFEGALENEGEGDVRIVRSERGRLGPQAKAFS